MARRTTTRSTKAGPLSTDARIVVLYGPEEMLKQARLAELRAALKARDGEVETFAFDGRTAALSQVLDELRSYSLMQTHKLVLVDDAEVFVKNHRQALERYAVGPVDHATLVLRSVNWNRGNLDDLIKKVGVMIECKALEPADAKRWLIQRAKSEHGCTLTLEAAALLIERLGTQMMQLDTEVAKLAMMVEPGKPIEAKLVADVVGRTSEETAWKVQETLMDCLATGSAEDVIGKIHELVDLSGESDVLVNYCVADLMRKFTVGLALQREGMSGGQIGRALKLWPQDRQDRFLDALRRVNADKAGRWFGEALRADARAKSGLGESVRNLECFCVRFADEIK
jgi:DNA polymerase-3 subunit delta